MLRLKYLIYIPVVFAVVALSWLVFTNITGTVPLRSSNTCIHCFRLAYKLPISKMDKKMRNDTSIGEVNITIWMFGF